MRSSSDGGPPFGGPSDGPRGPTFIRGLARTRGADALEDLAGALKDHPDTFVREEAAVELGQLDNDEAVEVLAGAIVNDDAPSVRAACADALGPESPLPWRQLTDFGLDTKVAVLSSTLWDPDVGVRRAAAGSLGRLGLDIAADDLYRVLTEADEESRSVAAESLTLMRGSSAEKAIISGLRHPSDGVRLAMVRAIGDHISNLDPENSWTRSGWFQPRLEARRTRVDEATRRIIEALASMTGDSNPTVRDTALRTLSALHARIKQFREEEVMTIVEDDEGTAAVPISAGEPLEEENMVANAIRSSVAGEPDPRYADLELTDVPPDSALQLGEQYELVVAIRNITRGLPAEHERRPIREPRQSQEVTVWVTAEGDGFEIEQQVQSLVLPPAGDSRDNAIFRVTPLRETVLPQQMPEIRIRLYYKFNLLEVLVLRAQVVGKFDDPAAVPFDKLAPVSFRQERLLQEYLDLDDVSPRRLQIDVDVAEGWFRFHFAFFNEALKKVEFEAASPLRATDLEDTLVGIRSLWLNIANGDPYSKELVVVPAEAAPTLRKLAGVGQDLWSQLFLRATDGDLYHVGEWLQEHPPESDALFQVTTSREASHFLFPWALLYDKSLPPNARDVPDCTGFWGCRYQIEQRGPMRKAANAPQRNGDGLGLGFLCWDKFPNMAAQESMLSGLQKLSDNRLVVGDPVTAAEDAYELLANGSDRILYFYSHGHTRHRRADLGLDTIPREFMKWFEGLDKHSSARKYTSKLHDRIASKEMEWDRSWIMLTYGRLYLKDLRYRVESLRSRPLVFLNMCESAQVIPTLSESFIEFFLSRNAEAVIGTECPMTVTFAHPFSEQVLTHVVTGQSAGRAILKARRHFLEGGNPLGLAYTVFGDGTFHLMPPETREKEG